MKVGDVLDNRYQIIKLVGSGRSEVYLAMDSNLKGKVLAVKVIQKTSKDFDSFLQETKLLSKLNHQGIPNITQQIEDEKECCVVMSYYSGETLYDLAKRENESSADDNVKSMKEREKEITEIFKSLCEILIYIHSVYKNKDVDINAPIIHRDIKPENIMLTDSGVKLIDWGTAGEFTRGVADTRPSWGTKAYAAPEQFTTGPKYIDERTDIYALGATIYYALTGISPGEDKKNIMPLTSMNPNISEGMGIIVDKCLKYSPEERYQYADEILHDLEHIDSLTNKSRNEKRRGLIMFGMSLFLCAFGAVIYVVSNQMINTRDTNNYQAKIQQAYSCYSDAVYYQKQGDSQKAEIALDEASEYYTEAIEYDGSDIDTYIMLFNCLLPQADSTSYDEEIMNAVDIMRKQYIDDKDSAMYHSNQLMYVVSKKCIDISDNPVYARYAAEYLKLIQESDDYSNGIFSKSEIDSMYLIATSISTSMYESDIDDFVKVLEDLENKIDKSNRSYDDKLNTYYTIINQYSRYSSYIVQTSSNPYEAIQRIGEKSKVIIESQAETESLTFSGVIKMYQMVADGLYEEAIVSSDLTEKRQKYQNTLEWMQYISGLNSDMTAKQLLKWGNCYKGIYETYYQNSASENSTDLSDDILSNLMLAKEKYNQVLNLSDDETGIENTKFSAQIGITLCCAYDELRKTDASRDIKLVKEEYENTKKMHKENFEVLGISQLSQYQSLTALVKRLEVE